MALIDVDWRPDRRKLRQFGAVGAGACALLIGLLYWKRHLLFFEIAAGNVGTAAAWLAGIGVAFLLAAWLAPVVLRPVYLLLTLVTLPIGLVVSFVVLSFVFFVVFTAVALWFRLVGRDLMRRRFDPDADSYWDAREPAPERERYFRQF